jgi:hypothetical protein
MDTTTEFAYMFQCISGQHYGEIKTGTELEQKARERGTRGIIDAVILGYDDCPACVQYAQERDRKAWSVLGCPIWEHHEVGCTCTPDPIPDSPYDDQIKGIIDTRPAAEGRRSIRFAPLRRPFL